MTRRLKQKLLIGVAVVAVLAGVTAAVVMAARPAAHHRAGGPLATAAGYLGVSPAQLRSELQSGKSLAAITDATAGKSEAGLVATLVAARKASLAARISAGKITQGQANAILPTIAAHVRAKVDRVHGKRGAEVRRHHSP